LWWPSGPVRLAGGLVVVAEFGYDALPSCDIFIVCGGPGWRNEATNAATLAFLGRQDAMHVASVCTGALILPAAGVLDGRPATTRRRPVGTEEVAPLDLLNDFARDSVPGPAAVVDAGVVTGGGVTLAIDATLYLVGRFIRGGCSRRRRPLDRVRSGICGEQSGAGPHG
jgi:transcriptional regulator GlxA family with amidase domain